MYLIIRKSDETVLERCGSKTSTDPVAIDILNNTASKYGGVVDDYTVLYVTDDTKMGRLLDGDSFDFVYDGGGIIDLDFSVEDNKKWVFVSVSKSMVIKNGVDSTTITFEIWKSDQSEIDTTVNESNLLIPIKSPLCEMYVKSAIVNGVCSFDFVPEEYGTYIFPFVRKHFGNYRVIERVFIESVYEG